MSGTSASYEIGTSGLEFMMAITLAIKVIRT